MDEKTIKENQNPINEEVQKQKKENLKLMKQMMKDLEGNIGMLVSGLNKATAGSPLGNQLKDQMKRVNESYKDIVDITDKFGEELDEEANAD